MKALHIAAYVLLFVGGLNWGYFGLTGGDNLIEMLLGNTLGNAVNYLYILIGAATLYVAVTHRKDCKICGGK